MKTVTNKTMKILGDFVQITGNRFDQIEENAFNDVLPKTVAAISFFNFSKNTINSISPKSFERDGSVKCMFDFLTIKNNNLSCNCGNVVSFVPLTDNNGARNYLFLVFKQSNRSLCWNKTEFNELHLLLRNHKNMCKNSHCHFKTSENYFLKSENILISVTIGLTVILAIAVFVLSVKWCTKV